MSRPNAADLRRAVCRGGWLLTGLVLLSGSPGPAVGASGESRALSPFAVASVHFEQNATDGDVEVVFEVQAGDEGVKELTVVSPSGRTVIDFRAPDAATLGIRQFSFESPEPRDVESLKAAYPEGVYTFTAATAAGETLHGESTLSHELPPTASLLRPGAVARSARDVEIAWTPVQGLAGYVVEVEQDELGLKLKARLPGSVTALSVPDGFLVPGARYDLGLGTVTEEGNISLVETTFTTAEKE